MECSRDHKCILCRLLAEDVTLKNIKPEIETCPNLSKIIDRRGNNALHCYVSNKCDTDINVIRLLLSYGVDRLRRNKERLTPLGVYSRHRCVKTQIVNLLISSYSDSDYTLKSNINDFDMYSYISSDNIDIHLLEYLIIDRRIRPLKTAANSLGLVDIYVTVNNPRLDVLRLLLKSECYNTGYVFRRCMYEDDVYKNALHYYILSHTQSLSKDIIKCLIDNNISVNGRDEYRAVPVQYYWSCSNIDVEIVKLLIKDMDTCITFDDCSQPYIRGVLADYLNPRFRGTPYSVDMAIVDLLIGGRHGLVGVINSITSYDSIVYNHEIIDVILNRFRDQDTSIVQTMLMQYLRHSDMVNIPVLQLMLDNGASMNVIVNSNYPLHEYFDNNTIVDVDVVRFIVENNGHVAVNHATNSGRLCMYSLITSMFSSCGVHIYETILIDILDILIKYIDDIDMIDNENKTLLYYAVDANNIQLVKRLLEYGASVNTTSCSIINAAMAKSRYRREKRTMLVDLLLSYHPTLERMIDAFSKDICYLSIYPLLACIRYALILDIDFPSKIKYNITNLKELKRYKIDVDRMKNASISGVSMFDIFFKRSGYDRLRYVKNIEFLNFASKVKWYKDELTSIIIETVKNSELIDSIVDNINIDDNLISNLPIEIQRRIFYYAIPTSINYP
ncbi:ankyrin [Raccoonpox virus]|uniref:Ankyrin repeat-containing protein n=1 Tax=Raccoon poxvirus TaxID=10256 RepID=A0A0G3FXH4_RACVI|nr:Ankyrin repeat-containing protein [Raccoonpox virus]YP_009143517.1 Ankyrin repeat-containing protein [Raccoonpox virus]AKJ93638.1 Ankyrin repeat-containing protein [Raccoonpox virus]AKJ93838.1 Ankyrin repeat-containing protein [Raccoonpox virus]AOP31474.1 ankyrin [Raccoonpox virus]